jgi:hypothetical protein
MGMPALWVVSLLSALEPKAPWSATYERTAEAIVKVAESDPLFEEHGAERTATLLVAVAWYESRLKPDARSKDGRTYCLYQIEKGQLEDPKKALEDPEMCTRAAVRMLRRSLEACKARAPDERLAMFVSGQCDRGGPESRYRMYLAKKLLKEHPLPPAPLRE